MRRPRPAALTGAEWRALRVIDEALTEENPRLSSLLEELAAAERPGRRVRTMSWIYVAVSVVVLVFGLVEDRKDALETGITMLCVAEVVRRWREERRD